MATRAGSLVVYVLGLLIVLAAIWVLFTQTGLQQYIPMAVVIAAVLLVAGLAVMASSDRFGTLGPRVVEERGYGPRGRVVERERTTTGPAAPPGVGETVREREYYDEDVRRP